MVVKIYISGISGNKEVKKRQQRVQMILDSKNIKYDIIDITEPGKEADKDFMQNNAKSNGATVSDPNPRSALPPQIFNDDEYCGDYDQFDLANEVDTLEQFLKMEVPPEQPPQAENEKEKAVNGDVEEEKSEKDDKGSKENSQEKDIPNDEKTTEKEGSPIKEGTPSKESTLKETTETLKEHSASREATPAKAVSKEGSPVKDGEEQSSAKPSKETTPERQKSADKEGTPSEKAKSPEKENEVKSSESSKENTPEKDEESVNENGTVSSHEQSEEKDADEETDIIEQKKDNPSEALIESEKITAAD